MAKIYNVSGQFVNGNSYAAQVEEVDYPDFLANYMNSTDNGVTLDPETIEIIEEEID